MIDTSNGKRIDIAWQVGLQVSLLKQIEGKEVKFQTQIVGWSIPNFIIVHTPYLNGFPLETDKESECFIRLLSEGETIGFENRVIRVQLNPIPLIFLSYPSILDNVSARKEKRFKTLLPAVIQTKDKDGNIATSNGLILNLSSTGCLISTQNNYHRGSRIFISFSLATNDEINDLSCYVNNVRESKEMKLLGIEFDEDSKEKNKSRLDKFINPIETLSLPE